MIQDIFLIDYKKEDDRIFKEKWINLEKIIITSRDPEASYFELSKNFQEEYLEKYDNDTHSLIKVRFYLDKDN